MPPGPGDPRKFFDLLALLGPHVPVGLPRSAFCGQPHSCYVLEMPQAVVTALGTLSAGASCLPASHLPPKRRHLSKQPQGRSPGTTGGKNGVW